MYPGMRVSVAGGGSHTNYRVASVTTEDDGSCTYALEPIEEDSPSDG